MFKRTYLRVTIIMLVVFFTLSFGLADYNAYMYIHVNTMSIRDRERKWEDNGGREGARAWDKYSVKTEVKLNVSFSDCT